jgi:hypothetical protein
VTEQARLVHGSLDGGSADTGDGRNLVDRPIAQTVTLYLNCHDAQNSSLALSVVVSQIVRQRTGTTERSAAVARCLPVGGPLALARSEPAKHPAVDFADLASVDWSRTATQRAPAFNRLGKVRRLAIADPALAVALPELPTGIIKLKFIETCIDQVLKCPTSRTERLDRICQCCGNAFDLNCSA